MQVFAVLIGLDKPGICREVRHHTHLNLRVVRGHEFFVALAYDKRGANLSPSFGAHRDILQIWFRRGQAASRCHRLIKRGVNAPIRLHGFD